MSVASPETVERNPAPALCERLVRETLLFLFLQSQLHFSPFFFSFFFTRELRRSLKPPLHSPSSAAVRADSEGVQRVNSGRRHPPPFPPPPTTNFFFLSPFFGFRRAATARRKSHTGQEGGGAFTDRTSLQRGLRAESWRSEGAGERSNRGGPGTHGRVFGWRLGVLLSPTGAHPVI